MIENTQTLAIFIPSNNGTQVNTITGHGPYDA